MTPRHLAIVALLTLAVLAGSADARQSAAGQAERKVYCWQEGGRKVCGDALPASAVEREHSEMSPRSARPTRTVERTLTADERRMRDQEAREAHRIEAAERAIRQREMSFQTSFSSEEELQRAFGEQIALMDEMLTASKLGIQSIRQNLVTLLERASGHELRQQPVGEDLIAQIHAQRSELLHRQRVLDRYRQDKALKEADMAQSLQRFRELRGQAPG